jgi:hypothetical protein
VQTEEDLVETALLRYAQQRATAWGADRFAAEFRRRDLEERWLDAARTNTTPYTPVATVSTVPTMLSGPVDASAQEHAVETEERDEWRLTRPAHVRHSSVARAPVEEQSDRGRPRRRKRERVQKDLAWTVSTAEAARMSSAGRRLYGLEDPSDPGR